MEDACPARRLSSPTHWAIPTCAGASPHPGSRSSSTTTARSPRSSPAPSSRSSPTTCAPRSSAWPRTASSASSVVAISTTSRRCFAATEATGHGRRSPLVRREPRVRRRRTRRHPHRAARRRTRTSTRSVLRPMSSNVRSPTSLAPGWSGSASPSRRTSGRSTTRGYPTSRASWIVWSPPIRGSARQAGSASSSCAPTSTWDKGRALWSLFERVGLARGEVLAVFIGDDVTDEDAFVALGDDGIGIVVADEPRPTDADYRLSHLRRRACVPRRARRPARGGRRMSEWLLVYEGFDPQEEGPREALCALGNGYFVDARRRAGSRSRTTSTTREPTSPGSTTASAPRSSGRVVHNESLVNVPNWLPLTFRADGGPWFGDAGDRGPDAPTRARHAAGGSSPASRACATPTVARCASPSGAS